MSNIQIKKVNKITTVQKILESLREFIKNTQNPILPNETELSNQLGVSRLTVREAVTVLESEGLVSRIQGRGTLINSFATKLENRIDLGGDIESCLKDNGYLVYFRVLDFQFRKADDMESEKLNLDSGESILEVKKLLYANHEVAAVYIDRIPERLLKSKDFTGEDLEPTIFPTIEKLCESVITNEVLEMFPYISGEELGDLFKVSASTPLLAFHVLEYTEKNIPLMFNTEYYTDKFIRFTLCRNIAYK